MRIAPFYIIIYDNSKLLGNIIASKCYGFLAIDKHRNSVPSHSAKSLRSILVFPLFHICRGIRRGAEVRRIRVTADRGDGDGFPRDVYLVARNSHKPGRD